MSLVQFFEFLYSDVGVDVEVLDAIYEAAKGATIPEASEYVEWYIETFGDDS